MLLTLVRLALHLPAAITCHTMNCPSTNQNCRVLLLGSLSSAGLTGLPICRGGRVLRRLRAISDLLGIRQRSPLTPLLGRGSHCSSLFIQKIDILCRLRIVCGHPEDFLPSCLIIAHLLMRGVAPHYSVTGHSVAAWIWFCFVTELFGCKLLSSTHLGANWLKVIIEFIV